MSGAKKAFLIVLIGIAIGSLFWVRHLKRRTTTIKGAVITRNVDPRKQLPVSGVEVVADNGVSVVKAKSEPSGVFSVKLPKPILSGQMVKLQFRSPDYEPFDLTVDTPDKLIVAALIPIFHEDPLQKLVASQTISNVVVRYSIRTASVVTIGSAVRAFEVINKGNVPCDAHLQCSPDGRWKAATNTTTLDAGEGNEFRNARASCIAGPCPFTRIDTRGLEHAGRTITVSATAWSDTATFLVEADVVHPMTSDVVRNSYPAIFGDALNFTLPPAAEGVSMQAELNGQTIIFPLGPAMILSWADCVVRANSDLIRVYRCELKPGYRWAKTSG